MPSSAITTVDAAAAADGQVAVEVVVRGPASECADAVEAVTAVHGAVALFGQVLQDLADVDGHPTDADVTILLSTIIHTIIKTLQNLTKHEQHNITMNSSNKPQLHQHARTQTHSQPHPRPPDHQAPQQHQPQERHQLPA